MADTFRIVTIGADGRRRVLEDLEVADVVYTERDTRTFAPGAGAPRTTAASTRYGGSYTTGELIANGTISATLAVKGPDPASAAATVERILERVRSARRDLYIEWRPENLPRSAFSPVRGPGTAAPGYRWLEWAGARRIGITVSWPVAPLAQDLPVAVYERWTPPADKPGGLVNLIRDPQFVNTVLPVSIAGTVSTPVLGGDIELNGRGTYMEWTAGTGAPLTMDLLNEATSLPMLTASAIPAGWYAVRARVKIRRKPIVLDPAKPLELRVRWLTAVSTFTTVVAATSSANFATYNVGDVIDLAGIVQAPAATVSLRLGIRAYASGAGSDGAVSIGKLYAAAVPAGTIAAPEYGDGESPTYRFTGAPFASSSVELGEPKLAEYTRAETAPPQFERVSASGGLYQRSAGPTTGLLAHTARVPVVDGEMLVGGTWDAGASYKDFLSPAIKWGTDGVYVRATVDAGNLKMIAGAPGGEVTFTFAAITGAPTLGDGKTYWLAIRAEGNQLTAEWYGSTVPNADRSNYLTRLRIPLDETTTPRASVLGRDRAGYPMVRARGMAADSGSTVRQWDYTPFTYTGQVLPETVPLRKVPGTAPALIYPTFGIGANVSQETEAFGLVAIAKRAGRRNYATTGDARTLGGWTANAGAVLTAQDADVPVALLDAQWSMRIQAHATNAGTGATYRTYANFRRGIGWVNELWVKAVGANVTVESARIDNAGATSYVAAFPTVTAAMGWTLLREEISTSAGEWRSIGFRITLTAGAGNRAHITAIELYEGTSADAPVTVEQSTGRGGAPPIGVIEAENMIDGESAGTYVIDTSTGATDLHNKTSVNVVTKSIGADIVVNESNPVLEYWVDPLLVEAPDFAGDTIDVVVYVLGVVDIGVVAPVIRASAVHEYDLAGSSRIFTREFGTAGRPIFPFTTAVVTSSSGNPAGFCTRLGTLSLPRRSGRVALMLSFGYGAASTVGAGIHPDCIALVPAWAQASTPTGRAYVIGGSTYPAFAPKIRSGSAPGNLRSFERRVRPDGSAVTVVDRGEFPYGTLGGEPLELEPGDGDLLAWCYEDVPDNPNQAANSGLWRRTGVGPYVLAGGARISVDLIPRYRLLPA